MNHKENSVKFFLENVGTSYHPGRETPEQGTERLALELAEAEVWAVATGYCFHWRTDPYLTSKEFNSSKPYYPLWMVTMYDKDGGMVDTFGGVDFGRDGEPWGDSYRRLLEAQLALEIKREGS